jgi:hypothetical protein
MTDREIWQGYDELRKHVEAEMGALEDQFRQREQGVPMSPGTVRKMIRRRRELREAMEVFCAHQDAARGLSPSGDRGIAALPLEI